MDLVWYIPQLVIFSAGFSMEQLRKAPRKPWTPKKPTVASGPPHRNHTASGQGIYSLVHNGWFMRGFQWLVRIPNSFEDFEGYVGSPRKNHQPGVWKPSVLHHHPANLLLVDVQWCLRVAMSGSAHMHRSGMVMGCPFSWDGLYTRWRNPCRLLANIHSYHGVDVHVWLRILLSINLLRVHTELHQLSVLQIVHI